ncbi:hypothetical protein A3F65_02230 [Candidatus Saccharibacteria bacterium RIFCSPHIGHO2_12_FULL_47_16b]|nr:MAG: hypothetical protein A3F65_02230 [Candidatus Saccharibacteria bacterium RIFCSPHIGHO2_12_FULL_47_16b]OGL38940.1 MAG: hypothetical protein A3J32_00255 [Candidatus Saccharibacteria bacterium RIFCSPLOWO2_02_FULL_46_7]
MAEDDVEEKEIEDKGKVVKSKRKWPKWAKILSVIAVIIGAVIIIAILATSGVAKTGDEFLNAIKSGNADAAYALFTREAAAATDKASFRQTVDRIKPILNGPTKMTDREAKGETGQAATGKVVYEIKGTDGVTYQLTINLQKEDGKWKVLNFESTKKK